MSIFSNLRNWLLEPLLGQDWVKKQNDFQIRRDYRLGKHKAPIKTADDAIIINFIGLQVERSVANLFGKEPQFDLPGEADSIDQQYIDAIWNANRKMALLKSLAVYGAETGTCYVKILPDAAFDRAGNLVPRLIALDPSTVTVESLPEDIDTVIRYTIAYTLVDSVTNQDKAVKQVVEYDAENETWNIRDYVSVNGGHWSLVDSTVWEWNFAPIVHWQNLPAVGTVYGRPDITADLIDLQDKINFVSSNTAKIIKYHAYPRTWARGFTNTSKINWGVDEMVTTTDPNGLIQNLEMQSDLSSSLGFIRYLRQAMFDVARSVDIDSLADKLGSLTNFGLRVLYQDALSKLDEKRGLYGEGITEINHRLLELAGAPDTDGGVVKWPDILPVDAIGQSQALRTDVEIGLVSKQTASQLRGYEWTDEEARIADEKTASDNIGAALLRSFGQGS